MIKDVDVRKYFMLFRISSHKLEIEQGRHRHKKIGFLNFVNQEQLKMKSICCFIAVLIILYVIYLLKS